MTEPITLKFRVTDDAKNVLKGMTVRLYEGNEIIQEIEKSKSVVEFVLEEKSIYTIEAVLNGFITKRVSVMTDLLDSEMKKDEYRFNIHLERSVDYRGISGAEDVLEYPSAILEFDTNSGIFDYNETYLLSTQKALQNLYKEKLIPPQITTT
jgi:hypothetical protein